MIEDLIDRMQRCLSANRPEYCAHLKPGITREALAAFEDRFSLTLPADFGALYKWRDGQDANYFASLQGDRMFSSLHDIADTKEMLDGMIGYDFDDPKWWRRGWVPFLSNGGGDHLCIDVFAEDGGDPGQLIAFWHDWEERSIKYQDLAGWLSDLVESMENGTLELT